MIDLKLRLKVLELLEHFFCDGSESEYALGIRIGQATKIAQYCGSGKQVADFKREFGLFAGGENCSVEFKRGFAEGIKIKEV
jgi:hypothetical protein